MIFLPEQSKRMEHGFEKIDTYLKLSTLQCPVFKSAVIYPNEVIDDKIITELKEYFKTEETTIRYQYLQPTHTPIQGGNKYKLEVNSIAPLQTKDTILWVLEPINRLNNDFGINMHFHADHCVIEIVGKGFDVSDLNRGQISPHETISTDLPIRMGAFNEWWKFLTYKIVSDKEYEQSKKERMKKLIKMGLTVNTNIFNEKYVPLSLENLEKLLEYITNIHNEIKQNDYCVSCSISNNKYVFWDIQTPTGKKRTFGV